MRNIVGILKFHFAIIIFSSIVYTYQHTSILLHAIWFSFTNIIIDKSNANIATLA